MEALNAFDDAHRFARLQQSGIYGARDSDERWTLHPIHAHRYVGTQLLIFIAY